MNIYKPANIFADIQNNIVFLNIYQSINYLDTDGYQLILKFLYLSTIYLPRTIFSYQSITGHLSSVISSIYLYTFHERVKVREGMKAFREEFV